MGQFCFPALASHRPRRVLKQRKLDDLHDFAIHASDGTIGHIKDFYFDDHTWVVRYFVVETGSWLASRKVLISPIGTGGPDWQEKALPASITMDQVRNSLDIDTDKPVSRQHEGEFLNYYIVNTSSWWLGHQVLIAPQSIKGVSWFDDMVSINLTREQMKNAPHYYPATP